MFALPLSWLGGFFGGGERGDGREGSAGRRRRGREEKVTEPQSLPAHHPDISLVNRVRSGDRTALDEIVRLHFSALAHCAYNIVRSRDEAEDVAQDVFVDLWTRRERWMPMGGIRAYLLVSARHRALNYVRNSAIKARHAPTVETTLHGRPVMNPSQIIEAEDAGHALDMALDHLSDRAREAVLLRYESECTFAEVASILGVSLSSAQKLVQRGVARLRDLLADEK